MHKFISQLVVFILLSLLIASFALWGIGDVFRSNPTSAVAKVGDSEISEREFRNTVSRYAGVLQQYGADLSSLDSKQIENQVLATLVNQRLLSQEADRLDLMVNNTVVAKTVTSNPSLFVGGEFNTDRYKQWLRLQGMTEDEFIHTQKQELANSFLIDAFTSRPYLSSGLSRPLLELDNETRSFKVMSIPESYISTTPEPTDAELINYYEYSKDRFRTPEYRSVSYIEVTAENLPSQPKVTDEELEIRFQEEAYRYSVPEMRTLEQVFIEKEANLPAVEEAIKAGGSLEEIAHDLSHNYNMLTNITEQELVQSGLIAPKTVDTVFDTAKGKTIGPVAGELGWYVYRVKAISQGSSTSFDSIKKELRTEMQKEKTEEVLYEMANHIDELIASGMTLNEIAAEVGVPLKRISGIALDGSTQNGVNLESYPSYGNFLGTAFSTESGMITDLVQHEDGQRYYVLSVGDVIAPRDRALDEIAGQVRASWKEMKRKELLMQAAQKIAEEIHEAASGTKRFVEIAQKIDGETELFESLTREKAANTNLPSALLEEVYAMPIGSTTQAYETSGAYAIALVTEISAKDTISQASLSSSYRQLEEEMAQDLQAQYLLFLQQRYPIQRYMR